MRSIYYSFILSVVLFGTTAYAQTLSLNPARTRALHVGDTLSVEVWASLDSTAVTGVNFYIDLPKDVFEIIDSGLPGQARIQPFQHGELFKGAGVFQNDIVSNREESRTLLQYAALFAQQPKARSTHGTGRIATLHIRCLQPAKQAQLHIIDDPVNETRLALPDGIGERAFLQRKGLAVDIANARTNIAAQSWASIKRKNY